MKKAVKMVIVLLVLIIIAETIVIIRNIDFSEQQVEDIPTTCEICGAYMDELPFKLSIHYGLDMGGSLFDVYMCEDHAYTAYNAIINEFSQELSQ